MKHRIMKQHVFNIVQHYNAFGKVKYNDEYIELVNKFPTINEKLEDTTVNILFDRYIDENPSFDETMFFMSTRIGYSIFCELFGTELIDDILKDNRYGTKPDTVSFDERYGL